MKNKIILGFTVLMFSLSILAIANTSILYPADTWGAQTKACGNTERSTTCRECDLYTGQWILVNGSCPSDTPASTNEKATSSVNSISKSYMDTVHDSAVVKNSGGCGPCGGSVMAGDIYQISIARNYISRRAHRVWDLGLGQASNFDTRLSLTEESDGSLTIYQELPSQDFAAMYLDGRRGDVRDGVFHGSQQNSSVEMHLLDGSGSVVQNYSDAVTIRFVDFAFNTYEFEVISMGPGEFAGRLLSVKNLNGYGYEITYKSFTQAQIDLDPALQWQKDTVTDSTGRSVSFTYHAAALGGEYVIHTITLPNSAVLTYEYTDTYLSKVTYPGGAFSTYSYSVDTDGDTVYTCSETTGKVKEVHMGSNAMLVSSHTGQVIWNQSSMGTGAVITNGEVFYAYFQHPTVGNYGNIYSGEGQMKFRHIDRQVRYFTDWTAGTDGDGNITYNTITGTKEGKFLNRNYNGPNGIEYPSSVTDKYGDNCKYHYDSLNRLVFKSYSDNTFEAWSYNSLNLKTRHRDRLGRVTLKTYDSRGNLLTREVGLTDTYTGTAANYNHAYWRTGNLTQIAGVSASQSSGNNAKKAIDGNTNGQYNMYSVTNTNNELNAWWKVQLVRSSEVQTVKIYNRKEVPERLADFNVTLYDGATQVYQQTIAGPVASEGVVEITLPAGTFADSVEIMLNGTNHLSLAEVEVYGIDTVVDAEEPIADNATTAYGIYKKEYYPSGHANQHLLRYEWDANNNRTEYIYDANNRLLQVNEPDDTGSGYHAKMTMTYDAYGRVATSADAVGRITSYEYDDRERLVKTTYSDNSTELNIYGTTNLTADLVVKKKDRNGNVTKFEYDNAGRVTKTITAYSAMDDSGGNEVVNPSSLQSVSVKTYLQGQKVPRTVTVNGDKTEYDYDYRLRVIETKRHADANSILISSREYKDNKLFKTTDPYGRRSYSKYRYADSALVRTVQETVPGALSLTSYSGVKNQSRDFSNNAAYLITDYEKDAEQQTTAVRDPRNVRSEIYYDSRGRSVLRINDAGTGKLNQTVETLYDANSNVIEMRNPRYFSESVDDRTAMTYNRRNMLESRTAAYGSAIAATETFTYYNDGRAKDHTDFRNNTTTKVWKLCCGRLGVIASPSYSDKNGNTRRSAKIMEYDYFGNATHTAVVDWDGNIALPPCCYPDPDDALTRQEVTVRFDERHRPVAQTVWLDTLGTVDPNAVQIAGDSGVTESGLTVQTVYFDETTGHAELTPLLNELAADGVTFNADADGSAVISINGEGEATVSIQDGVGRTVATGMYDKDDWALGIYTLVTWNTVIHDTVDAGTGLLVTESKSALNHSNKVFSDGAGRRIKTVDASLNEAVFEYDANSNLVKSRDANGVGMDCIFDNLNRDINCTDTKGDTTGKVYNHNNNVVTVTDAKGKSSTVVYDDRNRTASKTDRIGGVTSYEYDANNNVIAIWDANQVTYAYSNYEFATRYKYDSRNLVTDTALPGHPSSGTESDSYIDFTTAASASGYDRTSCSYDALSRKEICTDQQEDTVSYIYDLASRLKERKYRTGGVTLESADSFTYDDASRLLTAHKGRYSNTCIYTYDEIGRRKSEKTTVGGNDYTITHTFDADSRVTNCAYPQGKNVSRTWTDRNQLASVSFDGSSVVTSTYDPGMRESTRTFGNGLVNTMTYNLDNTRDAIAVAGKDDLSFNYTYDDNKNVVSESSATGSVMNSYSWDTTKADLSSGFDANDRVINWERENGDKQGWDLDLIGNWGNTTGTLDGNAFNEDRTHNDVNELTDMGGNTVQYDAKGNMTNDAWLNSLSWDIDNHLQSHNSVTFTYDALGRRLEKKTTTGNTLFICNGQQVVEEYTDDLVNGYQLARSYVYGSYIDDVVAKIEGGSTLYYHSDRQYNVRGITDSTGAVVELYAYSVYGKQIILDSAGTVQVGSAVNNFYGYTGRYIDSETGLWYFRARYFSDEMGRFINRDPLGYVDGMSLYNAYFAQIFGLDPMGMQVQVVPKGFKIRDEEDADRIWISLGTYDIFKGTSSIYSGTYISYEGIFEIGEMWYSEYNKKTCKCDIYTVSTGVYGKEYSSKSGTSVNVETWSMYVSVYDENWNVAKTVQVAQHLNNIADATNLVPEKITDKIDAGLTIIAAIDVLVETINDTDKDNHYYLKHKKDKSYEIWDSPSVDFYKFDWSSLHDLSSSRLIESGLDCEKAGKVVDKHNESVIKNFKSSHKGIKESATGL